MAPQVSLSVGDYFTPAAIPGKLQPMSPPLTDGMREESRVLKPEDTIRLTRSPALGEEWSYCDLDLQVCS